MKKGKRLLIITDEELEALGSQEISPTAKFLYLVIRSYANKETGMCFPTCETLSECSGIKIETLRKNLRVLKNLGLVDSKQRGRGRSNNFIVNMNPQKVGTGGHLSQADKVGTQSKKVVSDSQKVGTGYQKSGNGLPPEQYKEQIMNNLNNNNANHFYFHTNGENGLVLSNDDLKEIAKDNPGVNVSEILNKIRVWTEELSENNRNHLTPKSLWNLIHKTFQGQTKFSPQNKDRSNSKKISSRFSEAEAEKGNLK